MGIPHITHIKLLWGEKIINYGLNTVFHWKSMKNSEKIAKQIDKSSHVALYSHIIIEISNLIII